MTKETNRVQFNTINLATMEHVNRRVVLTIAAIVTALLVLVTGYTMVVGVRHYRQRIDYEDKIERVRSAIPEGDVPELAPEAVAGQAARVRFTNRLIVQDRFPWIVLLDAIEAALPAEVVLTEIRPTEDSLGLSLSGHTANVNELVRFQRAVEGSGLFQGVNLSTLSLDKQDNPDTTGAGIRFNMVGRFRLEALFPETDEDAVAAALAGPAGG